MSVKRIHKCVILIIFKGLNYGIDFKGGTLIELRTTNVEISSIRDVLKKVYGKDPYMIRVGGSIPILSAFYKYLGIHATMFAFQLDDENWHAPNEFFRLSSFYKGQEAYRQLFHKIGGLSS